MLGDKIAEERKKLGYSQEELSDKLNATKETVDLWESNQEQPSVENLIALSQIFNISIDELCCVSLQKEKEKPIQQNCLFKTQTAYNIVVYEHAYKYINKSRIILFTSLIFACILLSIGILVSNTDNTYMAFPILFAFIFSVAIVSLVKNTKKFTQNMLVTAPNLVHTFYFFDDHIEIQAVSTNTNAKYSKKYTELKVQQDSEYFYLVYDGLFSLIDKRACNENLDKINELLSSGQIGVKNANGKTTKTYIKNTNIKAILITFICLSIASIFIALIIIAISINNSPLPEFPSAMTEYMWKFFLLLPIPISSIIIGVVFKKKGYKATGNIIVGIIMTLLLTAYGCFSFSFGGKISHDYSYVTDLSNTIGVELPDEGYVSTEYNFMGSSNFSMVKYSEDEERTLVSEVNRNYNWQLNKSFIPTNAIDLYVANRTSGYDYFIVYNFTNNMYNDFNGRIAYLAYDLETNILCIVEYY